MAEEGILATGETVEVMLEGKDGIHQAVFEGIGAAESGSAPVLVLRIDDDLYDWPLAEVAITQTE